MHAIDAIWWSPNSVRCPFWAATWGCFHSATYRTRVGRTEAMISTGLLGLFLEIVGERKLYVASHDLHVWKHWAPVSRYTLIIVIQVDSFQYYYLVRLLKATTDMLSVTEDNLSEWYPRHAQVIDDFLDRLPMFWECLWKVVIPTGLLHVKGQSDNTSTSSIWSYAYNVPIYTMTFGKMFLSKHLPSLSRMLVF